MNEIRWEAACVGNGVCGVEVDRKDIPMNKLVATTLEHLMHVYDVRTQHPDEGFACKRVNTKASTTWSAKHLPQDRDFLKRAVAMVILCCTNITTLKSAAERMRRGYHRKLLVNARC